MSAYLINSTLCSAMLFLAYQLLLKNKAIYNFNRFYLFGTLLLSLLIPLITLNYSAALPAIQPAQALLTADNIIVLQNPDVQGLTADSPANYTLYICVGVYGLITALLLFRFFKNLYKIRLTVLRSEKISYEGATLVLIEQEMTPHTFLNYIFLNKEEYLSNQVATDILCHELAHARQRHSIDMIWMELVQAAFWFNPVLIFYRRAIRLNHEFIADAKAINTATIISYQRLLLNKAGQMQSFTITSQFNYSITKKRLIMMTKTTSPVSAWISRLAIIPVLLAALILFCVRTSAQEPATKIKAGPSKPSEKAEPTVTQQMKLNPKVRFTKWGYPFTKEGVSEIQLKEYRAIEDKYVNEQPKPLGRFKKMPKSDQDRLESLYKQMSAEQQQQQTVGFMYGAPPLPRVLPTPAQLNEWASSQLYGVWINQKRVKNARLGDYKPEDFAQVFISRLTKKAVENYGFHTQVDLMTTDYYKTYRRQALANRYTSRMYLHYSKSMARKN